MAFTGLTMLSLDFSPVPAVVVIVVNVAMGRRIVRMGRVIRGYSWQDAALPGTDKHPQAAVYPGLCTIINYRKSLLQGILRRASAS